jgi:uncharacterized protein (TIGR01777 family)
MTYLITGATGFIGSKLIRRLSANGDPVHYLARKRSPKFDSQVSFHCWNIEDEAPLNSVPRLDAIIHLTGEPVAQRWTKEAKKRIYSSRIEGTRNLVSALAKLRHRPEVLVTASAVGYYGDRADEILTEQSPAGTDFLAKTCVDWEAEAVKARVFGMRVVPVRFATVLGPDGGAFPLMARPARFGLGATFGSGQQWMSWIHVEDLVNLLLYAAAQASITETLNGASPQPVTNAAFTKALGQALHRPAFLSVPKFVLQAALGEMSEFLFDSLRVVPEAVARTSFEYRFGELSKALADLTQRS